MKVIFGDIKRKNGEVDRSKMTASTLAVSFRDIDGDHPQVMMYTGLELDWTEKNDRETQDAIRDKDAIRFEMLSQQQWAYWCCGHRLVVN